MSSHSLGLTSSQNWSAGNQYESSPQPWRPGNQYGYSHDDEYGPTRPRYIVPATLRYQPEEGDTFAPWRLFEERVRSGPYGLTSFPSQPYSPFRILILSPGTQERVNPRLTRFIRDSSPGVRTDRNLPWALEPELPGLTDDEFKKAMRLLKEDIYNPTTTTTPKKKKSWPRGFFSAKSSNTNINITGSKSDEETEKRKIETKSCTICLEDFVANERVLVTPCNHMFHGHCLEPWVKSQGKCPVCRFGFLDRVQRSERASSLNNNSYNNNNRRVHLNNNHNNNGMVSGGNNNDAVDLVYLIRAMEEALNWLTVPH